MFFYRYGGFEICASMVNETQLCLETTETVLYHCRRPVFALGQGFAHCWGVTENVEWI